MKRGKAGKQPVAKITRRKQGGGQKLRLKQGDCLQAPEKTGKNFIKLQDPTAAANKRSSTGRHQEELENLADTDPEFYDFLRKNDANLLNFEADDNSLGDEEDEMNVSDADDDEDTSDAESMDEDDEEDDSDDEDDSESDDAPKSKTSKASKVAHATKEEVTVEMVKRITEKVFGGPLVPLKQLLSMFRSACIPSGVLTAEGSDDALDDNGKPLGRYIIVSGESYEHVMLSTLETVHVALRKRLDMKESDAFDSTKLAKLDDHPKWKRLSLLVISFFKSVVFLLDGLAQSTQQTTVCIHIIDMLEHYIPFLAPLPRLTKTVLKTLLKMWARPHNHLTDDTASSAQSAVSFAETEVVDSQKKSGKGKKGAANSTAKTTASIEAADSVAVAVSPLMIGGHALLRIRQMASTLPGTAAEECFRSLYLLYARQSKTFTEHTAPCVTFMAQSIAEVYTIDAVLAYQQAFLYIRQLALHLRLAMLKPSSEKTREITSMQFLNCLRLWTRVICRMPSAEEGLGSLAFPLLQVMIGVLTRTTSAYFIPLKFHIINCMQQIAAASKSFVPTAGYLFEILESADLFGKATPSTELAPRIESLTRFPTNSIGRVAIKDLIVQEAMQLILQDAEVYRFNAGLPEYTYLTIRRSKTLQKKCKNSKWRGMMRTVTGLLEQYADHVLQVRDGPQLKQFNLSSFETFLGTAPSTANCMERLSKLSSASQLNFVAGAKGNRMLSFGESIKQATSSKELAANALYAKNYHAVQKEQLKAVATAKKEKAKLQKKKARGDDSDDSDADSEGDSDGGSSVDYDEDSMLQSGSDSDDDFNDDDDGDDVQEFEELPAPPQKKAKQQQQNHGKVAPSDRAQVAKPSKKKTRFAPAPPAKELLELKDQVSKGLDDWDD